MECVQQPEAHALVETGSLNEVAQPQRLASHPEARENL
jgi:hypothetical protein